MVKKIFQFIGQEITGLHQAAYLLGLFAFLSQLAALLRDRLLASAFGASQTLDIYYAAFRFPDLVFVVIASMVSISVLIPMLTERLKRGNEEAKNFINTVFSAFSFCIVLASAILFFFLPYLLDLVFPVFKNDPLHSEFLAISRIFLLSPIFLGISNFLASITQVFKRFFVYALSPVLYNFGIIVGILFLYPVWGLRGLALGVVIGAVLHFLIQVPFVLEKGLFPQIKFHFDWKEIKSVVFQSLPRTLTLSANELAEFALIAFAGFMSVGSIAIYNFSWNLQSVPLSIIGVSYSLAAFPTLSKYFADGRREEFISHLIVSARHILFLAIPATVLFIVLRAQIVRVILGTGDFGWTDTRLTAAALALFVVSLVPQSLIVLFTRAYYSVGKTKVPFLTNTISAVSIILLAFAFKKIYDELPLLRYFLESLLKVEDLTGSSVLVLPLSYSLGLFINLAVLWFVSEKEFPSFSKPIIQTLFKTTLASILMGYVAYLALIPLSQFFGLTTLWGVFGQGFSAGLVGLATGFLVLKLLKSRELEEMIAAFHRRFKKVPLVASEDPSLVE